jgi:peptidylprolyl isomerase
MDDKFFGVAYARSIMLGALTTSLIFTTLVYRLSLHLYPIQAAHRRGVAQERLPAALSLDLLNIVRMLCGHSIQSKENPMQTAENGMYVSVTYTGTLENGEQFDSSEGRPPLELKLGAGQMIPGFEAAVAGMALNETKVFTLGPEEAYGQRDESRTHEFPRKDIPSDIKPEVGHILTLTAKDGRQIPARVVAVDEEKVTFDLNHPLAGEALTFDIKVVGINDAPTQKAAGCGGDCSSECSC